MVSFLSLIDESHKRGGGKRNVKCSFCSCSSSSSEGARRAADCSDGRAGREYLWIPLFLVSSILSYEALRREMRCIFFSLSIFFMGSIHDRFLHRDGYFSMSCIYIITPSIEVYEVEGVAKYVLDIRNSQCNNPINVAKAELMAHILSYNPHIHTYKTRS